MTRVAFFMPSLKIGGGNKVFIELANQLAVNHNCKVKVAYIKMSSGDCYSSSIFNYKINLIEFGAGSSVFSRKFSVLRMFFWARKNMDADFIIVSDPVLAVMLPMISQRDKVIRFMQEDDYNLFNDHPRFNFFMKLFYQFFQRLSYRYANINYLANSGFVRSKMLSPPMEIKCHDIFPKSIHPALSHCYLSVAEKIEVKSQKTRFVIGCVGRIHGKKGFPYFIKLIEKLNDCSNSLFEYKVMSCDDLSEFSNDQFKITPVFTEVEAISFYKSCDIFVSTSLFEGFGMPPLEAMACGCAVVLFDCEGYREYAIDGNNCVIVPVGAVDMMVDAIIKLKNNASYRQNLIDNGKKIAQKFSWQHSANNLMAALEFFGKNNR